MLPTVPYVQNILRGSTRGYAAILSPNHSIYVSNSVNPYFNLSLEDWLFRHKPPKEPLLLLYRDRPCVVIGRNQNPWKEVNMRALRAAGIPFIRRRSGEGPYTMTLGTRISRYISLARHLTDMPPSKWSSELHVSGSAYKIVNNRAYHHGTMLISTRLDLLGHSLRSNKDTMHTKGVASVRSPVRNLEHINPLFSHDNFVNATIDAFGEEYDIREPVCMVEDDETTVSIEYIRHGMAELPSWHWAYGQTPEFTHHVRHSFPWGEVAADIHSKHGIILSCSFILPGVADSSLKHQMEALSAKLEKQRYGFVDEGALGPEIEEDEKLRNIWQWLKTEMDS